MAATALFAVCACLAALRFSRQELPRLVDRAREAGVGGALVPGANLETSRRAIQVAERLAGEWDLWPAVGVHPTAAGTVHEETVTALHRMGRARRVRAI